MSCCGSCAHGRKCEGKKRNPNFLYLANGRRARRRRNPASNTWIYQANGKKRTRRKVKVGPLNLNIREFASERAYQRDWNKRHARDLYLPSRDRRGRFKKRRS